MLSSSHLSSGYKQIHFLITCLQRNVLVTFALFWNDPKYCWHSTKTTISSCCFFFKFRWLFLTKSVIWPAIYLFLLSHEEVGSPLRWRLPLESPSTAPQEELEQESKGRVSAPLGTITRIDPQSLEMVGRECVEEKIKWWILSGRKCDRTVKQRRDGMEGISQWLWKQIFQLKPVRLTL